jgi:hypothetical protein
MMRRFAIYAVFLTVAGGAVALGLDLLIETDQERIEKVLDDLRAAAAAGDTERLVPLFDLDGDGFEIAVGHERDRFAAGDLDSLEERLSDAADWLKDASLRFESTTIEVQGERAHAYFRIVLQRPDADDESIPVDLTLRRHGDAWLATRFRALTTDTARAARR